MHLRDLQKANKYFHPGSVWVFFPIGVFCRLNKHQHFYQDAARIDTWKQVSFGISRRRTCYTEELTKGEYSRSTLTEKIESILHSPYLFADWQVWIMKSFRLLRKCKSITSCKPHKSAIGDDRAIVSGFRR